MTLGQIVNYTPTSTEATALSNASPIPAIVTKIMGESPSITINCRVIADGAPALDIYKTNISSGTGQGQYHV